jgi:hypothetical protein
VVRERVDSGGVTSLSRTSTTSGTLSITEPVVVTPEPAIVSPPDPAPSASKESPEVEKSQPPTAERTLSRSTRVRTPEVFEIPTLPPVASIPEEEVPTGRDREPRLSSGTPSPPEPLGAGAWWGVGTGALASGGILAALRRRKRRSAEQKVEAGRRID